MDNIDQVDQDDNLAQDPVLENISQEYQEQNLMNIKQDANQEQYTVNTSSSAPITTDTIQITPDTSSYDNSTDLKKHQSPWKVIGIISLVLLFILGSALVYFYLYSNKKLAESTDSIKHYQKELADSKTLISEYESATQTKVVDIKDQADPKQNKDIDEKKTDKQIVKWNDLNVNFGQLATLIGDDFRIRGGRIVTNEDGSMIIAKMAITPLEKQEDPNGLALPSFIDHGIGRQNNVYIRKLPGGSWQYVGVFAVNGMGVIECKNVSEEMKTAVTTLNKYETDPNMRYSCINYKNGSQGDFETFVF